MEINLIINAIPNASNMPAVQEYLGKIMPLFAEFGGEKIERYQTVEQIMGTSGIKMTGVFVFPDVSNIKEMLDSEAFKQLSSLRAEAFTQLDLLTSKPF